MPARTVQQANQELEYPGMGTRLVAGGRKFPSVYKGAQTGSRVHPAFYATGTTGKHAKSDHPLTAIRRAGWKCVEPYLLNRMKLHGATLMRAQRQGYIYLTFGCAIYTSDIM